MLEVKVAGMSVMPQPKPSGQGVDLAWADVIS